MQHFDFNGKVILITGGSQGIGKYIKDMFIEAGGLVINFDKTPPEDSNILQFFKVDITIKKEIEESINKVPYQYKHIDILINNAGIAEMSPFHMISDNSFAKQTDVNFRGTFLMCKTLIPSFIEQGHGIIVNISSVNGINPEGNDAVYAATKAAIISLTKSIAIEYSPIIRAACVAPGSVDTEAQKQSIMEIYGNDPTNITKMYKKRAEKYPMKRIASPKEIASVCLFLCSEDSSFINGTTIVVDGGIMSKNQASLFKDVKY